MTKIGDSEVDSCSGCVTCLLLCSAAAKNLAHFWKSPLWNVKSLKEDYKTQTHFKIKVQQALENALVKVLIKREVLVSYQLKHLYLSGVSDFFVCLLK